MGVNLIDNISKFGYFNDLQIILNIVRKNEVENPIQE